MIYCPQNWNVNTVYRYQSLHSFIIILSFVQWVFLICITMLKGIFHIYEYTYITCKHLKLHYQNDLNLVYKRKVFSLLPWLCFNLYNNEEKHFPTIWVYLCYIRQFKFMIIGMFVVSLMKDCSCRFLNICFFSLYINDKEIFHLDEYPYTTFKHFNLGYQNALNLIYKWKCIARFVRTEIHHIFYISWLSFPQSFLNHPRLENWNATRASLRKTG